VYAAQSQRAQLFAALRWRPEWPAALLVLAAWLVLLSEPVASSGWLDHALLTLPVSAGEHEAHQLRAAGTAAKSDGGHGGVFSALPAWTLMSVAMMLPVALPAIGHVGVNSLRGRRLRAMALYVAVIVGVWVVFGVVVLTAHSWLRELASLDRSVLLAAALSLAAVWQVSGFKRRALNRCHRTVPLPPLGLRADAGCARFALVQGWRCLQSCWALMLVMAVVGHAGPPALGAMIALTFLIAIEELTREGSDLLVPSAGLLSLAAGLALGLAAT
jgi:predicted metal-binding membrane protein